MHHSWLGSFSPKHLYIHWPFCKNKCHYCDFVAFEKHQEFKLAYHNALLSEISSFATKSSKAERPPVETIFLGGGTPSLYPEKMLIELFEKLSSFYDLSDLAEATIEVNPGDIKEETVALWKSLGLNRMSIGVQVIDDQVLKRLNRMQTKKDVDELLAIVPKYFSNISIDLILGLPGVSEIKWQETLDYVIAAGIQHISLYFLTVHEKTPLYFRVQKGELKIPTDDTYIKLYEESVKFLEDHGFFQYEISNFARVGFESKHNRAYWSRNPYKGFGLGAASFDGVARYQNIKNLNNYLAATEKNNEVIGFSEIIDEQKQHLEQLMLGLRQKNGVHLHSMLYCVNEEKKINLLNKIEFLIKQNLIEKQDNVVRLTLKGMALENEVILSLV